MTKEELAQIEADLDALENRLRELREERDLKRNELRAAQLAYAQANPHPWVGKRVWRLKRFGLRNKTQREEGTVVLYNPAEHRNLRKLRTYRAPKPGDPIVVIDSGPTGWALDQHKDWRGETPTLETDWALVEEKGK